MTIEKQHLSWDNVTALIDALIRRLPRDYDAILAVTRGGMVPACLVSETLNIRNILAAAVMFYTEVGRTLDEPVFLQFPADPLLFGKRILIVDDVWDSGRTVVSVKHRVLDAGGQPEVAVIHYKPAHSLFEDRPDYFAVETGDWIVYPWDPTVRPGATQVMRHEH